jgi:hypothetical protein
MLFNSRTPGFGPFDWSHCRRLLVMVFEAHGCDCGMDVRLNPTALYPMESADVQVLHYTGCGLMDPLQQLSGTRCRRRP